MQGVGYMNEIHLDLSMMLSMVAEFEKTGQKNLYNFMLTILTAGSVWRDPPIINITHAGEPQKPKRLWKLDLILDTHQINF